MKKPTHLSVDLLERATVQALNNLPLTFANRQKLKIQPNIRFITHPISQRFPQYYHNETPC
jgi:hypothetical protein